MNWGTWRFALPFKGSYCWEAQVGPAVIQWGRPKGEHPESCPWGIHLHLYGTSLICWLEPRI